jgi:hypothetical protein
VKIECSDMLAKSPRRSSENRKNALKVDF